MSSDVLIDFLNTYSGGLDTPSQLVAWLAERELAAPTVRATRRDLDAAVELREAVRDLLEEREPARASAVVERVARDSRVGLRFADGRARLEPAAAGVQGALGRIVVGVADAMGDGSWQRVKVCGADDCRWAFYDSSKNGSRAWCSMQSCGNRAKVRAYRARQR